MKSQTLPLVVFAVIWCCGCSSSSPAAPSVETTYELRITESPSCRAMAAATPGNFFQFGTVTVHVRGSFFDGTFLLVDDSLAVFGAQCSNTSRPALRLVGASAGAGVVSGRLDGGVWSHSSCVGSYFGAEGAVSGTRDATTANGLLNGRLVNGIFALNNQGFCQAIDHTWSITPAAAQP
jgi:hypothetical protein